MAIEESTATADEVTDVIDTAAEPGSDPTAPETVSAGEEGSPELQLSADESEGAQAEGSAPEGEAPPEKAPTAPATPEYEPYPFRVDGVRYEGPGVYRDPSTGRIVIDPETWEREVVPNYMGHRPTWQKQRAHYERQLQALRDDNRPEIIKANTFADRMLKILELDDPVERDEELDKLRRDIPVLEARAEAQAARQQAEAFRGDFEQKRQQEVEETVTPILQDELSRYVQSALQHESLKDLKLDAAKISEEIWGQFGPSGLFVRAEEGGPADFDTPIGGVQYQIDRIDSYLLRRAELVRQERQSANSEVESLRKQMKELKEAIAAKAKNEQNLAPEKGAPPVVPAAGTPSGGVEEPKPWHDQSKTPAERKKLWDQHALKMGYPL